jgi:hypothetical protein
VARAEIVERVREALLGLARHEAGEPLGVEEGVALAEP